MIKSLRNARIYRDRAKATKLLLYFDSAANREAFIDQVAKNVFAADRVQLDGFTLRSSACDNAPRKLTEENERWSAGLRRPSWDEQCWRASYGGHNFYGWKSEDCRCLLFNFSLDGVPSKHANVYEHVKPAPGHDFYGWNPEGWLYKHELVHEAFSARAKACRDYVPPIYRNGSPDAWK